MDISLTDEQVLLRDTAVRLADDLATENADSVPSGDDLAGAWRRLVELGLPTFRSPATSGLDSSGVETVVVIEELARTLSAVPAVGQGAIAVDLLDAAGAAEELDAVAEGRLRVAPMLTADLGDLGYGSEGSVVFDAAGADEVIFAVADGRDHRLCRVAAPAVQDAAGGLDLTRLYTTVTSDLATVATPVGSPIVADRWERAVALARTVVAADLVGVMQGALDAAVRYAGERTQFGTRIGTFQAVQHMLADALVRLEGARSCVWYAAWGVDHLEPVEATLAAMTAKAYASEAAREVVETSVQVFGGIAITWEHLSHLRLRRVLVDRRVLGDETALYQRIAATRLADRELV